MTMDMSMLTKLLSMNPQGIEQMAGMAAMKAPPPMMPNPGAASTLAPGAFAGLMNPTAGAVASGSPMLPQGLTPPPMAPTMGAMPGAAKPPMGIGMDANQAGILAQMSQPAPLHFPGASLGPRFGQVQTAQMGVPQVNAPRPTLSQLLGG